ncbi:hypothetical protein H7F15_11710 [Pontibacter sp. Tf4]|uniref:hypothetical protein n=1 Tax=Pontibacter sp. Tf4 TaxID=2761620 RepID=UPI001624D443|nr:hypothetical protein [Pontibacter sp. Tf4]MBB6611706.1 hypothetical protein [Pontibacter sp. Tf4]
MERDERNTYYHSGLGSENRRDWDRSSRDGDFGRDYENRFRNSRDRDADYRRHHHDLEEDYYQQTQRSGPDLSTIRQGYGITGFGSEGRYTDTGEDIAERMRRDRERLQREGYGSGRMGGYSGSAFGGSNYSAHGDFSGASDYGSMSGDRGNVDDYTSMSGYGGGYGSAQRSMDRRDTDYSNRSGYNSYSNRGMESGMPRSVGRYSPDNYSESTGNHGSYGSRDYNPYSQGRNYSTDQSDRGGYRDEDPNNYRRDYEITQ